MGSSKLGDEVFENPFATDDYILETSPSSKNDDDMFTNEHTLEDNYSIAYDDTVVSWITDTGSKGYPVFRFGMGREGG